MADSDADSSVPEPARKLEALLGTWAISGSMTTEQGPAQVSGRWLFSPVVDGHGVRVQSETTIEGLGSFEEEELIGFDRAQGKVHLFALNPFVVRDHVGDWRDDRTLQVVYRGEQDGRACRESITIRFDGDRLAASVVETLDDEVVVETTLTLIRESSPSGDTAREPRPAADGG